MDTLDSISGMPAPNEFEVTEDGLSAARPSDLLESANGDVKVGELII